MFNMKYMDLSEHERLSKFTLVRKYPNGSTLYYIL